MKKQNVAIVTGAGSGIGRATALALIKAGYCVALAGRREPALNSVALASEQSERVLVVPTDVTNPASVKNLFDTTIARFGRVDLLFNNAGVPAHNLALEDLTPEQWKATVDTNLNGAFYCLQQAFQVMKRQTPQGGRIINTGSLSAHSPRPNTTAYTATKHAMTGLTRSAALDGRQYQIAVGQLDLGNVSAEQTPDMTRRRTQANGEQADEASLYAEQVALAVLYMAGLPLEANVLFQTLMPTTMPFVGRG
jgi:NADP-dependent 3-hydroxy acid dehydrogenase YdfG